jgi:molecular chaperone HscC
LGAKQITVTREQFEEATRDITARLRPVVRRCLRDARITTAQLGAVVLVGGASRMPMVRSLIQDDLGPVVRATLDPDRVVALGAAVQQALASRNEAVRDLVLTDVCSHTLGVAVAKWLAPGQTEPGYFDPIIDRNSTVPVSRAKIFSTLHPMQDEVRIEVFQGESRRTSENTRIGEMAVRGLKAIPGQEKPGAFEVRFTYDMNGLLEVEVTILETGQKVAKVFEQRPGQMSQEEILAAIRKLQPLKVQVRDLPQHRARLERANRLFAELSGPLRQELSLHLDAFEMALASEDQANIDGTGLTLDRFMAMFFQKEEPDPP